MDDQQSNDNNRIDNLVSPEGNVGMSAESIRPPRIERPAAGIRQSETGRPARQENTGPQIDSVRAELAHQSISGDMHPAETGQTADGNKKAEEKVVVVEKPMNDQERVWNTAFDVAEKVGKGIKMAVKAVGTAVGALIGAKG